MNLRWRRSAKATEPDVLQMWIARPRMSECAGIDYSNDGDWVDIPVATVPPDAQPDDEDDDYSIPVLLPDQRVAMMRKRDLHSDDKIVFDQPGSFATALRFKRRLEAEIAAAGGIDAWRAASGRSGTNEPADPCPRCARGGVCSAISCGRKRTSELMTLYGMPAGFRPGEYER